MAQSDGGFLSRWTLKTGDVIAPDERLPMGQTIALGLQHVVAMFGATVLAPLLMGFDPNVSILFSGISTLIFFFITGGKLPSYLGSSFSFIAVVIAATAYSGSGANANIGVALGGIIACGALYAIIGLIVMKSGIGWIETLMPPVVTGAIVAVIGLNLAPIAVKGSAPAASMPSSGCSPWSPSASSRFTPRARCSACRSCSAVWPPISPMPCWPMARAWASRSTSAA